MYSLQELEDVARKTVTRYNRFRGPEVFAKLVHVSTESVTVAFSGIFCTSCGVMGYIEGFVHDFKALTPGVELKIGKMRDTGTNSFEVEYKIKALK
ncbi:MAG: hypothetical protein QXU99_00200 [Candidatus Bathyarchaeia archaeon]